MPINFTLQNTTALNPAALPNQKARIKRCMDIGLIIALSPFALVVMALITLILSFGRGPVFHSQLRVGRAGRRFRIWKFRTMRPVCAAEFQDYLSKNPDLSSEWHQTRKLQHDPRVTRFGAFLRKSSMDELPQLWNILRGEMSLVGPRPVPYDELHENYRGYVAAYQKCQPGLTGLWQVSGRNRLHYDARVRLDASYAVNQNILLDLKILFRTIKVVLRGTGC